MNEQPPQTTRPQHGVVEALTNGAFLQRMFSILGPGDWWYPTETGFSWIPHRLRHDIDLIELAGGNGPIGHACRSTFVLCTDVNDFGAGLSWCHYFNQRSIGVALWLDGEERTIYATSSAVLDPARWFSAFLFETTVPRLVGILENLAPRLALLVDGKVPDAVHPTLGNRATPDQFIRETSLIVTPPEAGAGLWWSEHELEMYRRTLRFHIQATDAPHVADEIDPEFYDDNQTAAQNLAEEIVFGPADEWVGVLIQQGRHPDYGYGIELLLSTVYLLGSVEAIEGPPRSDFEAIIAANELNYLEHRLCLTHLNMGGWTTWRSQLFHSTFLMPEPIAMLQNLAAPHAGEALGLIAYATFDHSAALVHARDHLGLFETAPALSNKRRWDGVAENAGHISLLVDSNDLYQSILDQCPLNTLIDPVELPLDAHLVQSTTTYVTMGIFNPVGPSVGTIEIAINYALGRGFLIERLRHFLSPAVRLHAVLDIEGFGRLDDYLEEVVASLGWSTFDWWDTHDSADSAVEAMERGLRRFAEDRPETDFGFQAIALLETVDNPWLRLSGSYQPLHQIADGDDPIDVWIRAISDPDNINNHVAHIRSAWEGAETFLRQTDDPSAAQQAADRVTESVRFRKGVPGS